MLPGCCKLTSNDAHLLLPAVDLHLNQHPILHRIQLQIQRGEYVALIGPSGAGKTSLLRVLATEYRSTPSIAINQVDPWCLSSQQRQHLRAHIGLIWQKPPLPPEQNVLTAVQAGRLGQRNLWQALQAWWAQQDRELIAQLLLSLGLSEKVEKKCGELSGGELQRVGIARVLYQSPQLLLADEPVSSLDPILAEQALQLLLAQARQQNSTFVCSLHAINLALKFFPRIVGLRDGRIVFDCARADVSAEMLRDLYRGESVDDFLGDELAI